MTENANGYSQLKYRLLTEIFWCLSFRLSASIATRSFGLFGDPWKGWQLITFSPDSCGLLTNEQVRWEKLQSIPHIFSLLCCLNATLSTHNVQFIKQNKTIMHIELLWSPDHSFLSNCQKTVPYSNATVHYTLIPYKFESSSLTSKFLPVAVFWFSSAHSTAFSLQKWNNSTAREVNTIKEHGAWDTWLSVWHLRFSQWWGTNIWRNVLPLLSW